MFCRFITSILVVVNFGFEKSPEAQVPMSTGQTLKKIVQDQHFYLQQNQLKILEEIRALFDLQVTNCSDISMKQINTRLRQLEILENQTNDRILTVESLENQTSYRLRLVESLENRTKDRLEKVERLENQTKARLQQMEQLNTQTNSEVKKLLAAVMTNQVGAVFTRWGRADCPANTSDLLYSGSVGGSYFDHIGGATNYLCLPKNPQLLEGLPYSYAYVYGGEYGNSNEFRNGLNNGDDIPCAVCQSKTGSQKMMIPARIECLPGWIKQYAGYLGTEYHGHKSSKEYICMDESPQAAHKGQRNDNGALVYSVKAVCGALPCPPYKDGDTVTCVVCTI